MKTNSELQRDVLDELAWEPSVDDAEIGVSVENGGVVILNGTVKSLYEKWTAEQVAKRVEGVRALTDKLVVQLPGDRQYTDADIAKAALNALDWSSLVSSKQIKLVVDKGCITLEGNVEYYYQKVAADDAVRNLKGVRELHNLIRVKSSVSPSDVIHAIKKALHRAAQVDAEKISVEASDDKVILRGNVRTWAEREEAGRAAWGAPGVSDVQNDIRVVTGVAAKAT